MWLDVVIGLWPWGGDERSMDERVGARTGPEAVGVELSAPGSFKRRLNQSGWLADEVTAAGLLQQGKAPSMLAMVTGTALVEVLRRRRQKALPKQFTLAVAGDRVVAYAMSAWSEGDDFDDYVVKIKRGEIGSWPRAAVKVDGLYTRAGTNGGTLQLGDLAPFPVTWNGDPSSDELVERIAH
jgi:predicted protein tyrosine phosphatase